MLLGAAALIVAGWLRGPDLLRRLEWFEVRRIEVSGARLLTPHAVVAASGIVRGQSIWEDRALWEQALRGHPAIEDVRITRRLPGTLRVRIDEKRPVAFVEAGALRPATARGELLPIDPSRRPLDLPIVRAAWGDTAGSRTARWLLAEAGRLEQLDPGLMGQVSELRAGGSGGNVLVLSHRLADVVLPAGVDAARLDQLRAVLADLEGRIGTGTAEIDLRFDDQVVVRLPSSA